MNKTELIKFKNYYQDFITKEIEINRATDMEKEIFEFNKKYPLDNLVNLKIEDYCLGTSDSKNSLSYHLEFGDYKHTGLSIKGGTSYKFGIYFKDGEYKTYDGIDTDVESYWIKFINQLTDYLVFLGTIKDVGNYQSNYPLLKGMPMVITKLAFFYFPDKFINIGSKSKLIDLLDLFEIDFDYELTNDQLSFLLNRELREMFGNEVEFPICALGDALWSYTSEAKQVINSNNYWIIKPGKPQDRMWDVFLKEKIISIWSNIGDLSVFSSTSEMTDYRNTNRISLVDNTPFQKNNETYWEFTNEIQIGDIVYVLKDENIVYAKGRVKSNYNYDITRGNYSSYREIEWIENGEWRIPSLYIREQHKALINITKEPENINELEKLFKIKSVSDKKSYSKEDFLNDLFIDEEYYDEIRNTFLRKKNIILQGSPGVGKTYLAKKLFHSIIGEVNDENIEMIQFHQSYAYEDFVQGYRPVNNGGFELKNGLFYEFVKRAQFENENNPINPKQYCIIIDEINRGNLSKIFGELLMLIESDKRSKEWSVNLTYSDLRFYIPDNLFIIGTMNTSDKSLTIVDYALRRRFAFIDIKPAYSSKKMRDYLVNNELLNSHMADKILKAFIELNQYLTEKLGSGFVIGHSYFINQFKDSDNIEISYNNILNFEIKPLLEEYFFDDQNFINEAFDIIDIMES